MVYQRKASWGSLVAEAVVGSAEGVVVVAAAVVVASAVDVSGKAPAAAAAVVKTIQQVEPLDEETLASPVPSATRLADAATIAEVATENRRMDVAAAAVVVVVVAFVVAKIDEVLASAFPSLPLLLLLRHLSESYHHQPNYFAVAVPEVDVDVEFETPAAAAAAPVVAVDHDNIHDDVVALSPHHHPKYYCLPPNF